MVWATEDWVKTAGGKVLLNKAGHSFIKERMIAEDAVFGGENSGHYYFRDYFYLDNGLIPFLLMLEICSVSGKKLSEIYQPLFEKYPHIEETNSEVADPAAILWKLKSSYKDGKFNELDGVTVEYPDYRFNVRTSNTQPLLRLNLEAKTPEVMKRKTAELLKMIRE